MLNWESIADAFDLFSPSLVVVVEIPLFVVWLLPDCISSFGGPDSIVCGLHITVGCVRTFYLQDGEHLQEH